MTTSKNPTSPKPARKLPGLGRVRKSRPKRPCVCGCGTPTTGAFAPGHDARFNGWLLRLERGVMALDDIRSGGQFADLVTLTDEQIDALGPWNPTEDGEGVQPTVREDQPVYQPLIEMRNAETDAS